MNGRALRTAGTALTLTSALAFGYRVFASPTSQLLGPYPADGQAARADRNRADGNGPDRPIALTFDDGPNEPWTGELADLLQERDVRATFFVVGECAARYPDTVRRLAADGHLIGIHSWSHQLRRCVGKSAIRDQTTRTVALLRDLLGTEPSYYRPPWLLRTPAHFQVWSEQGLQPVSGHFSHPLEVLQIPSDRIAAAAVRQARPGRILIFHDGYNAKGADRRQTVDAVRLVLDALQPQGYRPVRVDELLPRSAGIRTGPI